MTKDLMKKKIMYAAYAADPLVLKDIAEEVLNTRFSNNRESTALINLVDEITTVMPFEVIKNAFLRLYGKGLVR